MKQPKNPSLNYRDAGVDIETGEALVDAIKPIAGATLRPEVLAGLGGFGALFEVPSKRYQTPVLVAATDGVGTKLKLAIELGRHRTVGIDLVAMCVNDIIVQGAEPLFFLDYFATGQLDLATATDIVAGIGEGCQQAGAALIGGETAEMPGMYQAGDYDLAGFCVGIVEKSKIISGQAARAGDSLIGLAASGPHSNGYSLIRKILETGQHRLDSAFADQTLGEVLLTPTRIYVKAALKLLAALPVRAIAHITGGGLPGNLPRVLPAGVSAVIDKQAWVRPGIFDWLQSQGNVGEEEMLRTFNCGIGLVIVVAADDADRAIGLLQEAGEQAMIIGQLHPSTDQATVEFK